MKIIECFGGTQIPLYDMEDARCGVCGEYWWLGGCKLCLDLKKDDQEKWDQIASEWEDDT